MALAIQLANSNKFTDYKKVQAQYFLDNFKFNGDELENLIQVSKKGTFIKNGKIHTIFPYGKRKKDLSFGTL